MAPRVTTPLLSLAKSSPSTSAVPASIAESKVTSAKITESKVIQAKTTETKAKITLESKVSIEGGSTGANLVSKVKAVSSSVSIVTPARNTVSIVTPTSSTVIPASSVEINVTPASKAESKATPSSSMESKLVTAAEQEAELSTPAAGKGASASASASPSEGVAGGGRETKEEGEGEEMDEETPVKPPTKTSKSSLKSEFRHSSVCGDRGTDFLSPSHSPEQWNTRSKKRKVPFSLVEEGHSVESTDTEDDINTSQTSAISSPAPSQG